jgi:hypothetical protein
VLRSSESLSAAIPAAAALPSRAAPPPPGAAAACALLAGLWALLLVGVLTKAFASSGLKLALRL